MPQKILYLCQDCKSEREGTISEIPANHHQRAAKKSRTKQRWSYKVK
jgi:hypothetical protein